MRLIRLSAEAQNVTRYNGDKLIFSTTFKDNLVLNPDAKIAFQSIFFDEFVQDLIIDNTNDTIKFEIEGQEFECFLNRDTYTKTTYPQFFLDFTKKLNKATPFNQNTIGREWRVSDTSHDKFRIQFQYGNIGTSNLEFEGASTASGIISADAPIVTNGNFAFNRERLAKGCGFLRGRINALGNFDLGFQEQPLNSSSGVVNLSNLFLSVGVEGGFYVIKILDTKNVTTEVPQVGDVVEIRINAGNIQCVYYRGAVETTLYTEAYSNEDLYPVLLLHDLNVEINNFSFSDNPYGDELTKEQLTYNLSIPEPLPDRTITVEITFQNLGFSKHLGFKTQTITQTNKQINFISQEDFDNLNVKYLYSVKLLNVDLESYDSEKQGKNNILYVINQETTGQDFSFTAPYLTFLEVKNKNPLSFRNIKCEVVNENDSIVEFYGKAILCLVVDD
jgi:hypothetical protein